MKERRTPSDISPTKIAESLFSLRFCVIMSAVMIWIRKKNCREENPTKWYYDELYSEE